MLNSGRLLLAVDMASDAHAGQVRKIDKTPYIVHPMAVAMILLNIGCREDVVIAGILHDTLEDTKLDACTIRSTFGAEVLSMVEGVSEDKDLGDWHLRKLSYIKNLQNQGPETMLISLADKYHNLFSIHQDLVTMGEGVWDWFSKPKADQDWYYHTLHDVYTTELSSHEANPGVQKVLMGLHDLMVLCFPKT